MKKVFCLVSVLALTACQAPYNRNVYQATGPRVCVEYWDSFRCSAPQRIWNETIYPKNDMQMGYGPSVYVPYQPQSLNRAVYGTM
jgi:hypothetical protein